MSQYADVILPLPLQGAFTYALPTEMADKVQVGCRVIVSFGSRKFYTAIVVRLHDDTPSYPTKLVTDVLDEKPVVLQEQLCLWKWIADYYLSSTQEKARTNTVEFAERDRCKEHPIRRKESP